MGRVRFLVVKLLESRLIDRCKTSYFLSRNASYLCSMREHLGDELEVDIEERRSEGSIEEEEGEQDIF
jgi:hypothetical protein